MLQKNAGLVRSASSLLEKSVAPEKRFVIIFLLPLADPKVRVRRLFNHIAVPYARRVLPRARGETRRDVNWFRPRSRDHVVDLACGPGTLALELAPRTQAVFGFDLAERMVALACRAARARRRGNTHFAVAEGERLPLPDESVSLIVCSYSFASFPGPQQIIAEMRRVARPDGRLGIVEVVGPTDPDQRRRLNRLEELRAQAPARLFCLNDFLGLFEQQGFHLLDCHVGQRQRRLDEWLSLAEPATDRNHRRRLEGEFLRMAKSEDLGLHLSKQGGHWVFYHTVARLLWQRGRQHEEMDEHEVTRRT